MPGYVWAVTLGGGGLRSSRAPISRAIFLFLVRWSGLHRFVLLNTATERHKALAFACDAFDPRFKFSTKKLREIG